MEDSNETGRYAALWTYGNEVTKRAPERTQGAFYGHLCRADDADESDASTAHDLPEDGFFAGCIREGIEAYETAGGRP